MPGGLHPPLSVIETWPIPNYVNPETRDWTVPVLLIVLFVVTFFVFCARMWARLVVGRNAGLDDALVAAAMIPLLGLTLAVCLGARVYGFQFHVWDQTRKTAVESRQIVMAIEALYICATCPTKISILCFYRRMASGTISKTFIYGVWASIAFVIFYGIAFLLTLVFTCTPVLAFWHVVDPVWSTTHKFSCHNEAVEVLSSAIVSIIQDMIACALPVMLVWKLQLPRRQKFAIMGIFAIGLLTCVSGIMRIYYIQYVYFHTYDITWASLPGWAWTAIEADLAVICASAPALKVFFRRYLNISIQRSGNSLGYVRNTSSGIGGRAIKLSQLSSNARGNQTPTAGIHVSHGMNVKIESRDEVSDYEGSERSSRELTSFPNSNKTLPHTPLPESGRWEEGSRTMCFAEYGPTEEVDVEKNDGRTWH
ncbi:hypothetical protein K432DRAFT_298128 [Lepidopterella palustris CBS 459.81]|uniref:Rhodopsin domain-containing protein n=1 Tax=Lepidopterella palustris CBS 459.81 TaxID=1314670 RepID=A0A8E2EA63_9PEZI|nr:hypothetical protein K432DRAFT_298128 [Lepidopterella palustris CBS 459.81]